MKAFVFISFICFPLIFVCCTAGDSGMPLCSGMGGYYGTLEEIKDTLLLSDSSAKWITFDTVSQQAFVNSNGTEVAFTYEGVSSVLEKQGPVGHSSSKGACDSYYSVEEYVKVEQKTYAFVAQNIPLWYGYVRSGTTNIGKDRLKIKLNAAVFNLPFNDSTAKNWKLLDSIRLSGKLYYNVYHVYLDSTQLDPDVVTPEGIYYTPDKGLVGFYLNNAELWGKR